MNMLTNPADIARFRLLTLKAALRLEMLGMGRRGRSALAILKDEGFTGNRKTVMAQLTAALEQPCATI